ncbi:MAG: pyrroline-5-carboxylate reductase [Sedimentisphaerales bacterium]|nr:pyrroline-5-carboxylate reductase [Sedimentisphaerales bacterium]
MEKIGFIGSGNMAEAIIKGVITAKVYKPENVMLSDIREERLEFLAGKYGVKVFSENSRLAAHVDVLVLSVKPQHMNDALKSIKDAVDSVKLVISIAAGIKISRIASVLGDIAIIRVMPNTPALIGEGAAALFANEPAKKLLDKATSIFSAVGKTVVVEDEGMIDAVTALSGSGPAYFFLLMEEMIKAGVELGLPEETAKDLVLQTAKGAGLLASHADKNAESPALLRKRVTSPGGTTEAAIKVFNEANFGPMVYAALKKAYERSIELS